MPLLEAELEAFCDRIANAVALRKIKPYDDLFDLVAILLVQNEHAMSHGVVCHMFYMLWYVSVEGSQHAGVLTLCVNCLPEIRLVLISVFSISAN